MTGEIVDFEVRDSIESSRISIEKREKESRSIPLTSTNDDTYQQAIMEDE